mmetsp:Transcript_15537/g.52445  ORF Transcript_15537/g.52445 Transcript_15537/m.52445 type:complete len:88 (-) Transcript_15537:3164-3427(-)
MARIPAAVNLQISSSQRLDTNLEKGRLKEMLQQQEDRAADMRQDTERKLAELRTQIEASKLDSIKYNLASLVSMCSLGLLAIRFLTQ